MITFNYETEFEISNESILENWIDTIISNNDCETGELNFIFCDDEYLYKLNVEFLNHDTFTDVISFDNTLGKLISGDIFISVERVRENAKEYNATFDDELHRVLIHGVLHLLGFKDKSPEDEKMMRSQENDALSFLNN
ncbi:MAG: rRNA maturation RNase YbeY [Flavobacteriia bacterium]|nr:rRNA maturation RNase YbeY [Flavobacteriia bacterium]OIP45544.1 MAG: rRNA maturation RNase YbeY [Flavobacteriaceae bacterium CG2_30_31_66]PIV96797.1 MAG: rRNA maturation RNase YbeY [Flavobacteriaceae bacterium CG17_big_fil_post_rev_8_21_14_2_50_31_13]PIX11996.1 MAG: rRNA maturation RNase YbeY [Flavobacteriaceae bacterium CG_4_8_14_3_um_filter_31_8]PIY14970.1 MAG: rRNA maturation RNase YbeY [Flavobacteriaceae bacterium CG_4_10_14_3_um_filter_31_253]PIZ11662.1 MAG: rRNA maturation RNase YbeY 